MSDEILLFLGMDEDSLQQIWVSNIQQKHHKLTAFQTNASLLNTSIVLMFNPNLKYPVGVFGITNINY